jgi:methanogenesis imperfect marker protein 11
MEVYTRKEAFELLREKKWVSPYKRVVALVDEDAGLVELVEDHARGVCIGGAAWAFHHYPKNSPLIISSRREGIRLYYTLKIGATETDLKPSYAPVTVEKVEILEEDVRITYSGLAGAGVAVVMGRALAANVKAIEVYEWGGGGKRGKASIIVPKKVKIRVGTDDTDSFDEGATWSLVNEIAYDLDARGIGDYLDHVILQLYPKNPFKTQNCVSVGASFGVEPKKVDDVANFFESQLKENTLSQETGMAILLGLSTPKSLLDYAKKARFSMVSLEESYRVAEKCGVKLKPVTGSRGLIGALAALPFIGNPSDAVKLESS